MELPTWIRENPSIRDYIQEITEEQVVLWQSSSPRSWNCSQDIQLLSNVQRLTATRIPCDLLDGLLSLLPNLQTIDLADQHVYHLPCRTARLTYCTLHSLQSSVECLEIVCNWRQGTWNWKQFPQLRQLKLVHASCTVREGLEGLTSLRDLSLLHCDFTPQQAQGLQTLLAKGNLERVELVKVGLPSVDCLKTVTCKSLSLSYCTLLVNDDVLKAWINNRNLQKSLHHLTLVRVGLDQCTLFSSLLEKLPNLRSLHCGRVHEMPYLTEKLYRLTMYPQHVQEIHCLSECIPSSLRKLVLSVKDIPKCERRNLQQALLRCIRAGRLKELQILEYAGKEADLLRHVVNVSIVLETMRHLNKGEYSLVLAHSPSPSIMHEALRQYLVATIKS